ncbi:hypothetical protein PPACK8108_LOCUS17063 [Phakopsora pachyrhizi]|uniref:Uncharacterized protein n=1 Tax=Phakopsora pachyrhizi TaxID=170000 RepID=A0AAV0BB13_PHAPC|nr:hypothetical protein PPACK8108_LOCUS17063 [Phakopsora pachyrhizi]
MASDFSRWAMGMEMEGGGERGEGAGAGRAGIVLVLPGKQGESRGPGDCKQSPGTLGDRA